MRGRSWAYVDVPPGCVATVAGVGSKDSAGDGGLATQAQLRDPSRVAVDARGNLFIADWLAHRVRRVDALSGIITTVAGTGEPGDAGDGGPAIQARLSSPRSVAVDGAGNLFIADAGNDCVRMVRGSAGPAVP